MVNLCGNRYRFAVGLAAALCRGHTSILPPNALPGTLSSLHRQDPGRYGLSDDRSMASDVLPLLDAARDTVPPIELAVPRIEPTRTAAVLMTSGSTGVPQSHARSWGSLTLNILASVKRVTEALACPTLSGLTVVSTVPAQHSYGFESSVLLTLLGGAAFDAGRPYFAADIAASLQRVPRPRALVTTPFHLKMLLLSGVSLPVVDLVLCATAPLSPQLAQQAERATQGVLLEIYGCTETGPLATRRTVQGDAWRLLDGLHIHRESSGADGTPTFVVQGAHVPAPTPLADLLALDGEQRFQLLGRANDVIQVAGKRSSLGHLNFHLNSIDGVTDGAFWLPDDVPDDVVRPVAFVVAPKLSAAQIRAALRSRIDAVFVPRRIVHVPELPRDATGKLSVQALRELAGTSARLQR